MKILGTLLFFIVLNISCSPIIEDARFYQLENNYPNRIEIKVNTREGFFEGRESFLHFKREYYTFWTDSKLYDLNESDLYMKEYNTKKSEYERLTVRKATISITKIDSVTLMMDVLINDTLIPKIINGSYKLKLVDSDKGYKMFSKNDK